MLTLKSTFKVLKDAHVEKSWPPTMVTMALEAAKESAESDGRDFHYQVIERLDEDDALKTYMQDFTGSFTEIPDDTHIHLAIRAGTHWTAMELKVKDGQVSLFCLDAAYQPIAEQHFKDIHCALSDARIPCQSFMFEFDKKKSESTGKDRRRQIQYSEKGCGIFTVNHLIQMGQFDVFEELERLAESGEISASKWNNNYYAVTVSAFHGNMAQLLTTTQSMFVIDTLPDDILAQSVDPSGTSLRDCVESHSVIIDGKKRTMMLEHTQQQLVQDARAYVETSDSEQLRQVMQESAEFSSQRFASTADKGQDIGAKKKEIQSQRKRSKTFNPVKRYQANKKMKQGMQDLKSLRQQQRMHSSYTQAVERHSDGTSPSSDNLTVESSQGYKR